MDNKVSEILPGMPHRLIIALLGDFGSESFLMSDVIGQYL